MILYIDSIYIYMGINSEIALNSQALQKSCVSVSPVSLMVVKMCERTRAH